MPALNRYSAPIGQGGTSFTEIALRLYKNNVSSSTTWMNEDKQKAEDRSISVVVDTEGDSHVSVGVRPDGFFARHGKTSKGFAIILDVDGKSTTRTYCEYTPPSTAEEDNKTCSEFIIDGIEIGNRGTIKAEFFPEGWEKPYITFLLHYADERIQGHRRQQITTDPHHYQSSKSYRERDPRDRDVRRGSQEISEREREEYWREREEYERSMASYREAYPHAAVSEVLPATSPRPLDPYAAARHPQPPPEAWAMQMAADPMAAGSYQDPYGSLTPVPPAPGSAQPGHEDPLEQHNAHMEAEIRRLRALRKQQILQAELAALRGEVVPPVGAGSTPAPAPVEPARGASLAEHSATREPTREPYASHSYGSAGGSERAYSRREREDDAWASRGQTEGTSNYGDRRSSRPYDSGRWSETSERYRPSPSEYPRDAYRYSSREQAHDEHRRSSNDQMRDAYRTAPAEEPPYYPTAAQGYQDQQQRNSASRIDERADHRSGYYGNHRAQAYPSPSDHQQSQSQAAYYSQSGGPVDGRQRRGEPGIEGSQPAAGMKTETDQAEVEPFLESLGPDLLAQRARAAAAKGSQQSPPARNGWTRGELA